MSGALRTFNKSVLIRTMVWVCGAVAALAAVVAVGTSVVVGAVGVTAASAYWPPAHLRPPVFW